MFISTYIGMIVGASLLSAGLGYYIANRGTAGVKIDLDNLKADFERLKAMVAAPVVIAPTPVPPAGVSVATA